MDAQTLTLFVLRATALLLAGAAVATLLRRAPAGTRHLAWLATLVGVLALPIVLRVSPLRLPVLPTGLGSAVAPVVPIAANPTNPAPRARATSPAPRPAAEAAQEAPAPVRPMAAVLPQVLVSAWVAVGIVLLSWLAAGMLAARRIVRTARPLDDDEWRRLLCEAADRMDLAELPRLVAAEQVVVPFATGMLRPTIVLPASAVEWTGERRRQVLVHELAHVRRRDLVAHTLARLACAVYWFHPLVWLAARRLRAESERACDDFVLACGARASDYAGFLLDVLVSARRRSAPVTAVPMGRPRELEGRVMAILDPLRRRGAPGRAQRAAVLAGVAVAFLAVTAMVPSAPALPYAATNTQQPAAATPWPDDDAAAEAIAEAHQEAVREGVRESRPRRRREREEADSRRPDPASRATLARVLQNDPEASVRRSAAWALAQGAGGEDLAVLAAALRGDADAGVREMAAWALSEASGADATAALAEALRKDQSAEVRATAAWALGASGRGDTAALVAALSDSAPDVRETLIWALGNQGLQTAPAPVTAALRDGDASVRLVAAWALGEILDPATTPALRTAFAAEKDTEVRRAIFRALALLDRSSSELVDLALASPDPELRQRAVLMAAGHGAGVWPWPWPRPQPRPFP